MVEAVLPKVSAEEIFMAVVVVISDADSVSPPNIPQTCLIGDIGEGAVSVVMVQVVRRSHGRPVQAGPAQKKAQPEPTASMMYEPS